MGAYGNRNAAGPHKHSSSHTHSVAKSHVSTPHIRIPHAPPVSPAMPKIQSVAQQPPHIPTPKVHAVSVTHIKQPSHVMYNQQKTAHYMVHTQHTKHASSSKIGKGLPGVH